MTFDPNNPPTFGFTPLGQPTRTSLVNQSADTTLGSAFAYVNASNLALSALGAYLDLDGEWVNPVDTVAQWRQITNQGREQYVRVVERGYLFPLGHRAVVIEIADRVFVPDPLHPAQYLDAYMQSYTFIRVLQPVKTYPAPGQPFGGRSWPFTSVEILTTTTPLLNNLNPNNVASFEVSQDPPSGFPVYGPSNADVLWAMRAVDGAGTEVTFSTPLMFVTGGSTYNTLGHSAWNAAQTNLLAAYYNSTAHVGYARRTALLRGAKIRFAPDPPGKAAAATHPVLSLTFAAGTSTTDPTAVTPTSTNPNPPPLQVANPPSELTLQNQDQPAFYPAIAIAQVRLPAAEALTRGDVNSPSDPTGNGGVAISPWPDFVSEGATWAQAATGAVPNPGAVYAQMFATAAQSAAQALPGLTFPSDAVGGISTPNALISGLSALTGAVAGNLANFANTAKADITDYFSNLAASEVAQLLGGLKLTDILGDFLSAAGIPAVPMISDAIDQATKARTITYTLVATASSDSSTLNALGFDPQPAGGGPWTFTLTATLTIDPTGGKITYAVKGMADPFNLWILGVSTPATFLQIPFTKLTFSASSGAKPDVDIEIGQIQFAGALSFVNSLETFLQDLGGSGFSIVPSPTGISASFSISLPGIGVGVFSLTGLSLSAGVVVPFTQSSPVVATFGFASRDKPFLLTVSLFGGGGYLLVGVTPNGVQTIEASLEFAGSFSLDLGVASGGVTIAAGFTYMYDNSAGTTLTGFVKVDGEVEVLGLITISLSLEIDLTYQSQGNVVSGTATLKVEVSISIFSVSVPITMHKEFAGSSSGPSHAAAIHAASRTLTASPAINAPLAGAPPSFVDLIPDDTVWSTYCGAFAG